MTTSNGPSLDPEQAVDNSAWEDAVHVVAWFIADEVGVQPPVAGMWAQAGELLERLHASGLVVRRQEVAS